MDSRDLDFQPFDQFEHSNSIEILNKLPIQLPYQIRQRFVPIQCPLQSLTKAPHQEQLGETSVPSFQQKKLIEMKIKRIIGFLCSRIKTKEKMIRMIKRCQQVNRSKENEVKRRCKEGQISVKQYQRINQRLKVFSSNIIKIKAIKKDVDKGKMSDITANTIFETILGPPN